MNTRKTIPSYFNTLLVKLLPAVGTQRYWSLVHHCQSVENLLASDPYSLPILNTKAKALLSRYQASPTDNELVDCAYQTIEDARSANAEIISIQCSNYPSRLSNIDTPPPLLFVRGCIDALSLPQLAIVGSRHATHQGQSTAARFSEHLASGGFTITSGLALGIDSAAHQAVINAHQQRSITGKTIAVMATGIDRIYPVKNRVMADNIIDIGGALVTEFMPKTAPKAGHFPQRNRIISGLSLGTLVIEAAIKSGSLITAKYATEQNREVFAVPGSIHNPQSKGCHQLIKQGANLVETSQDIVDQLHGAIRSYAVDSADATRQTPRHIDHETPTTTTLSSSLPAPTEQEQQLLSYIGFDPVTLDQLMLSSPLSHQQLSHGLLELEIKGWIKRSAWGYERV